MKSSPMEKGSEVPADAPSDEEFNEAGNDNDTSDEAKVQFV